MIIGIPFGFEYVEKGVSTKNNPIKHWVVRVSTTPLDALESLKEYDRKLFEYSGEHSIEFIEE